MLLYQEDNILILGETVRAPADLSERPKAVAGDPTALTEPSQDLALPERSLP